MSLMGWDGYGFWACAALVTSNAAAAAIIRMRMKTSRRVIPAGVAARPRCRSEEAGRLRLEAAGKQGDGAVKDGLIGSGICSLAGALRGAFGAGAAHVMALRMIVIEQVVDERSKSGAQGAPVDPVRCHDAFWHETSPIPVLRSARAAFRLARAFCPVPELHAAILRLTV
jgi:hypothetical protein